MWRANKRPYKCDWRSDDQSGFNHKPPSRKAIRLALMKPNAILIYPIAPSPVHSYTLLYMRVLAWDANTYGMTELTLLYICRHCCCSVAVGLRNASAFTPGAARFHALVRILSQTACFMFPNGLFHVLKQAVLNSRFACVGKSAALQCESSRRPPVASVALAGLLNHNRSFGFRLVVVHAGRFVRRKDDVHIVSTTVPSTKAAASLHGNRMKSFWTLWAIWDKRYVDHGYIQVLRSNAI